MHTCSPAIYLNHSLLHTYSASTCRPYDVHCHFDYACSAWYSGLQKTMKHKLQILQNKTMRFALDLSPRTHLDITHFLKMHVASSGCQSRTIKSQHHAQDCPWPSSMLSY